MNEIVTGSELIAEQYERRIINIVASDTIKDIGRFSLAKLPGVFRNLAAIVRQLFVFRPHIVYLSLSPSGFAFYRDVLYVYIVRLFGPELVFHLHGKGLRRGMEKSRLFKWLCKSIFRNSYVIFLSDGLRSDAEGLVYKCGFVVNYGLPDGPVPMKIGTDSQKETGILYLSNYVKTKGVLDLVDALELVSRTHGGFRVCLAGRPADITLEMLQAYVAQKGLTDRITISGPKYNGEKVALLESADVFVLPTYYDNEAFPTSILEAMKYGLAVVSTYEGGIPDMIEDGVDGLLYPQRDIALLAGKLIRLLDHPEEIKSIGRMARIKFMEKFTVSIFERNMLQVFRQICTPETSGQ